MALKRCPSCGNSIREDLDVCPYCKHSFSVSEIDLLMKAAKERQRAKRQLVQESDLSDVVITTGDHFDGYTITNYFGCAQGADLLQVPVNKIGKNADSTEFLDIMSVVKDYTIKEMKAEARLQGANAVIGVHLNYLPFQADSTLYSIHVTASGVAVTIRKN